MNNNVFLDYDRLPFSTGDGALYISNTRSASYQRLDAGRVQIYLEDTDGRHFDGWMTQGEKAHGVCIHWLETGEIVGDVTLG